MRTLRPGLRDGSDGVVSFFAFQDIIFAVTGIFIFITVFLMVNDRLFSISLEDRSGETVEVREAVKVLAVQHWLMDPLHQEVLAEAASSPGIAVNSLIGRLLDSQATHPHHSQTATAEALSVISDAALALNRREARLMMLQGGALLEMLDRESGIVRPVSERVFLEPLFLRLEAGKLTLEWLGRPELDLVFRSREDFISHLSDEYSPEAQSVVLRVTPSGIAEFYQLAEPIRALGFRIGYEPIE